MLLLTLGFFGAEVAGALWTNSLALLADAMHMLSDAGSLALALFTMWFAARPPTPRKTFGYRRLEILAALVNGVTLVAIAALILREAWERLRHPQPVEGGVMLAVALAGLAVNLAGAWLLHRSNPHANLNMKGAYLHVLGDALGSVGAIAAAVVLTLTGLTQADALVSVVVAVLILAGSGRLLRDTVNVLLEGTPSHLSYAEVQQAMLATEGVAGVHDLHLWTVTSGFVSLSAHVTLSDGEPGVTVLNRLTSMLRSRFGIGHITIQTEPGAGLLEGCPSCPDPLLIGERDQR